MTAVHRSREIVRQRPGTGKGRAAPSGRTEVSEVHTQGEAERAWILSGVLSLVVSDPPEDVAVRSTLDALRQVEGYRAAMAYLWDPAAATLVLTGTSPLGGRAPAEDRYGPGESVIGRAAMSTDVVVGSLQPPVVKAGARPAAVPTRSVAAAARMTDGDDLIGVVAVITVERAAAAAKRAVAEAAQLLGMALARRSRHASERRSAEMLEAVGILVRSVNAESSLLETLGSVAGLGLRVTRADACAVYVSDRAQRGLRLAAVAPRQAAVPETWTGEGDPSGFASRIAVVGSERVAGIVVFGEGRHATQVDLDACERLASVVAVAVRQRRLLDTSIERTRADDLLWEIVGASGRTDAAPLLARAHRVGCDLGQPKVVLVGTSARGDLPGRLRSAILAADPTALVDLGGDHVVAIAAPDAATKIEVGAWSLGVSQACDEIARYPLAYRQAWDTLDLGVRLFGPGHVVRFEDLGSYRFVPALIQAGLSGEAEYRDVSKLSDELLRTLEAYLDCGGNTALAAKQLYLHRNTLRQRLERISTILGTEVSLPDRWLTLQLAIKTVRMSRLDPGLSAKPRAVAGRAASRGHLTPSSTTTVDVPHIARRAPRAARS